MPGLGAGHFIIQTNMANDPMETGAYPMPDFNAPTIHEDAILQQASLILTNQFVAKVSSYMQPHPGVLSFIAYTTLASDVLKVITMAMEMSKPTPDAPKDFGTCYESASERILTLVATGFDPKIKEQLGVNMADLLQFCQANDML